MKSQKTFEIDWPKINTKASVRMIDFGVDLSTRIEDTSGNNIIIATPFLPSGRVADNPARGAEIFLMWNNDASMFQVPVAVTETNNDPIALWHCNAVGPLSKVQRRSYFRVNTPNVKTRVFLQGPTEPVVGELVDLSEGGMRVLFDRWAQEPTEIMFDAEVPLGDDKLVLRSQIAWWGDLDASGKRLAGIRFEEVEQRKADQVRRFVFQIELAARKRAQ